MSGKGNFNNCMTHLVGDVQDIIVNSDDTALMKVDFQ